MAFRGKIGWLSPQMKVRVRRAALVRTTGCEFVHVIVARSLNDQRCRTRHSRERGHFRDMGCLDDLFLPSPSLSGLTSAEKQLIHLNAPRPKREVRKVTWAELQGLRWLAEGGSCDVWSADLLGEPVAVKVIKQGLNRSEEARCSLAREAELLPLLSHRNILQLIGKGESEDGRPFLVLELLASVLADELPRPCVAMCGEPNEPDECTLCEFWSANPKP